MSQGEQGMSRAVLTAHRVRRLGEQAHRHRRSESATEDDGVMLREAQAQSRPAAGASVDAGAAAGARRSIRTPANARPTVKSGLTMLKTA
jgi:hypothetical protein